MANPLRELIKEARSTLRRAQSLRSRVNQYLAMPIEEPVPGINARRQGQPSDLVMETLGNAVVLKMEELLRWLERNMHVFRKLCPNLFHWAPSLQGPEATELAALVRSAARTAPLDNETTADDEETVEAAGDDDDDGDDDAAAPISMPDPADVIALGQEVCRGLDDNIHLMTVVHRRVTRLLPRETARGRRATAVQPQALGALEATALKFCEAARPVLRDVQDWVACMQEIMEKLLESDEASTRSNFAA